MGYTEFEAKGGALGVGPASKRLVSDIYFNQNLID